jgi:hypothetical protein
MRREIFLHVLQAFQRRRPWKPFTVELIGGSRIEVNHPESISAGKDIVSIHSTTGVHAYFEFAAVVQIIDSTGVG